MIGAKSGFDRRSNSDGLPVELQANAPDFSASKLRRCDPNDLCDTKVSPRVIGQLQKQAYAIVETEGAMCLVLPNRRGKRNEDTGVLQKWHIDALQRSEIIDANGHYCCAGDDEDSFPDSG